MSEAGKACVVILQAVASTPRPRGGTPLTQDALTWGWMDEGVVKRDPQTPPQQLYV